jgi:predicted GIY-YIG superfamily endonuclease
MGGEYMATKRFSPKRNFTKKRIESVTNDKPIVYKLLNSKDINIYTGIAKRGRVEERLKEHLPNGPDHIKGAKSFQIKKMDHIENARNEEKKIIKTETPKFNK